MDVTGPLTEVSTVFSQFMTWIGNFITTIAGTPILLIGVGAMVASIVIRLAYKAVHGRG